MDRDRLVTGARPAAAPQPAGSVSVADELHKLAALVQQGLLTQQEYEAQKERLLRS